MIACMYNMSSGSFSFPVALCTLRGAMGLLFIFEFREARAFLHDSIQRSENSV